MSLNFAAEKHAWPLSSPAAPGLLRTSAVKDENKIREEPLLT